MPEDHAVHHDRPVPGAISANVSQVESFGQRKITLDCCALPAPVKGVLELDVDLRPIESAFPFAYLILEALFFKRLDEGAGRSLPIFIRANGLLRPGADFHLEVEAENPHHLDNKINNTLDFVVQLLGHAKDMSIILGKLPDPKQPVQHAGFFVPVHRSQLEVAKGQVTVAADSGLVDQHVRQAVHRLYAVGLFLYLREIHVFAVVLEVAGLLPQFGLEQRRADHYLIAAAQVLAFFEVLQNMADERSLWVLDNHPGADFIRETE